MKDTITEYTFTNTMIKHGFSYEGAKALFDHLEQYEQDCDHELEFDPIAFCGEFSEYEDLADFQADYGEEYESIEAISDETTLIQIDNESFIIQQF